MTGARTRGSPWIAALARADERMVAYLDFGRFFLASARGAAAFVRAFR